MKKSLLLIACLVVAAAGCTKPATGPAAKETNIPAPTAPTSVSPGSTGTEDSGGGGQPADNAPPAASADA